ncbi:CHAT domain-containing protein [Ephemerocybe angulata]|uniref:CHAT domain-containing protein n=1 Tax=Ephemerocybe angulata TaxID=980116 RepID=A0A8H6IHK4_9AGAR|nr:CHAT domain-containing protein [Tulosesus angulatus]
MGQQNSSLVPDGTHGESHLFLTDISLERTDVDVGDHKALLSLTQVWIFGMQDSEDGRAFPLENVSPGRWGMNAYIELPPVIHAIDFIVKADNGEDVAFLHLDVDELRSAMVNGQCGQRQKMEMFETHIELTMSWVGVEIPLEPIVDDSALRLHNHGVSLWRAFKKTGELSKITDAVLMLQQSVDVTPQDDVDLPARLSNLGGAIISLFERTGQISDIARAVSALRKAVELTPRGRTNLPSLLSNLGYTLTGLFERTGELSSINEAISVHREAVELTPHGHDAALPGRLTNFGNSLHRRFESTGEIADITEAISTHRNAVKLTPQDDADLPGALNNLGNTLASRFHRTGDIPDITEAISVQQRAVELTPPGDADLPARLSNLGGAFIGRFGRTGEVSDIAESIVALQKAIESTPMGHYRLPVLLSNLGFALTSRFEKTGSLMDVNEAILAQRKAVKLTPGNSPSLPTALNNLGYSLTCRFARTDVLSDIDEAVSVRRKSVKFTPLDHPDLPSALANLGISLALRSKRTGEASDLTEALSVQRRAVELTPEGHASLPTLLGNLGGSQYSLFLLTGDNHDLEEALRHGKDAATSTFGPPRVKLHVARFWAKTLVQHCPDSPEIVFAFDTALALLGLIAGLEQTVRGRYTHLQDNSGLALDAAAAAFTLGRADKALEWLEQGRCLVWNQLNALRTPLDSLRAHNAELAENIATTAKQLESAGSSRGQSHSQMSLSEKISLEAEARGHLELSRQWDSLLKSARDIPGFESFLKPLPCSSIMQHLPEAGPIIVINVNESRCDAIALLAGLDEPLHFPLPAFSIQKAREYRTVFDSQLRVFDLRAREVEAMSSFDSMTSARGIRSAPIGRCGDNSPLHRVLRLLWEEVVKPTLDALGFSPNVPTAPSIPGTTSEVRAILERAEKYGVRASSVEGDGLMVGECIARMHDFSSIHLACHGSQNAAEPLQSRFLFHRGSLELGAILQSDLKNADLAFLSACQTSTGQEQLPDEAVHLAAGMLAAGYCRVVGTMWSIGDKAAQQVATTFYDYLFDHQDEGSRAAFDGSSSAFALQHATQQLRLSLDDSERSLLTWIPFIHFGL